MANHVPIPRSAADLGAPQLKRKLKKPSVRIVVQPVDSHRFRYKSEGRWAGSIPGVNKEGNKEGFPTIEISGCPQGKAVIVVSCVTKDAPYKTHPHGVVARELYMSDEEVKKGACKVAVELTGESTKVSFPNIGIHSCKHNEVKKVLEARRLFKVDPFNSGFDYGNDPKSIDLNALRLCFQVFLKDENDRIRKKLPPVVTGVIHDKKTQGELHITRISHSACLASGGTPVILLCKKVKPSDTTVVFLKKGVDGSPDWEETASQLSVHQNVAFSFTTPPYRDTHIRTNVTVWVQLKRLSDNARSEPKEFEYTPIPKVSDATEYIHKKPLFAWLQNGNLPMESEMSHEQACNTPSQTPLKPEPLPADQKPLQQWPTDLPPMFGPSSHQQYPALDMSWMDRSYVRLDQHLQLAPSHQVPSLRIPVTAEYSVTSRGLDYSHARNPFTCHYEENGYVPDNRSECHSLFTPSPDLNTGQYEEMQISTDKFSGIVDEEISDHLNDLSLKEFVGGASSEI